MKIYDLIPSNNYAIVEGKNEEDSFKFVLSSYIPKLGTWSTIELIIPKDGVNEKKEIGDITFTSAFPFLLSQKVVDVLSDELQNSGILFPISIVNTTTPYYYFYCTQEVDCLDLANSNTMQSFSEPGNPNKLSAILKAKFYKDKVNKNIFKIPQISYSHTLFFTDEIVKIMKKHKFTGVDYQLLD